MGFTSKWTTQHLTDIHFCDADTGYVVGFSGTILKTTNGGSSWTSLYPEQLMIFIQWILLDAFTGYAAGGSE